MQGIIVRSENPDDFKAIDVVHLSAFEGEDEARLVAALRADSGYSAELALVAEFNGRIVGHLMLTPAVLRQKDGEIKVLVLAPMSVVPSQSHRGIGTELVHEALKRAADAGYAAIIEAGKPDYYALHGFIPASRLNVSCNLPVPEDAVMAVEITEGALAGGGEVIYPPIFKSVY
ncbi:MAG: N-acetyltransferase [Granulosicoccaceae bacterium]|jgi:putative acetyltransferase